MATSSAAPRHFPVFDALRGYAILGVLVVHSSLPVSDLLAKLHPDTYRMASFGRFGVQLFYMVSACTLFWSMSSRTSVDRRPLPAFFLRRLFRIAPLFWVGILAYLWLWGTGPRYNAPDGVGMWEILSTFLFVHGTHPNAINSIVPGGWSIAVEMPFYLLVPLAFRFIRSLRDALRFFGFALCVSLIVNAVYMHFVGRHFPADRKYLVDQFLELWLPNQLPVFALGFALYFLIVDRLRHHRLAQHEMPASLRTGPDYLFLWTMLAYAGYSFYKYSTLVFPATVAGAAPLLVFAWMLVWWPVRALVNPVIEHIGRISYSVYIWHFFVLHYLGPKVGQIPDTQGYKRYLVLLGAMVVICTVVGTLSYYLIEKPMMAVGKMVIERLKLGPAPRTRAAEIPAPAATAGI